MAMNCEALRSRKTIMKAATQDATIIAMAYNHGIKKNDDPRLRTPVTNPTTAKVVVPSNHLPTGHL
jgi:hypothetical protein